MPPHHCNYCLKPIATEAGIKWHIAQSPACRDQRSKLLEWLTFTIPNDTDDQPPEPTDDDTLGYPYEWENTFDGVDGPEEPLDVPDGHLVHQSHVDINPGPPDLSEQPSKRAQVEEDREDSPWPSLGCFKEPYPKPTATILGKKMMMFEAMEAAELKKGKREWVPFRDEDKWELAQFLMKNLGQKKTDELLKLSHVSK